MNAEKYNKELGLKGILVILFLILFVSLIPGQGVQAASQKTKAFKSYSNMLSKTNLDWGVSGNKVTSKKCKFAIIYLDDNSVPELLIFSNGQTSMADGTAILYTYKNGKARFVNYINASLLRYYKKTGVIRERYTTSGGDQTTYWKLSGTKLTRKLGISRPYRGSSEKVYYSDSKSGMTTNISKAKFNSKLEKLVGTKKATKVKSYKNTASNRKKYLK